MNKRKYQELLAYRKSQETMLRMLIETKCFRSPREIIEISGIPEKRAYYILDKWDGKGIYDYGVCLDLGWLVEWR